MAFLCTFWLSKYKSNNNYCLLELPLKFKFVKGGRNSHVPCQTLLSMLKSMTSKLYFKLESIIKLLWSSLVSNQDPDVFKRHVSIEFQVKFCHKKSIVYS